MGGNNPLIIAEPFDSAAAVYFTLLSAYLTAGQRCTCARRLFVPDSKIGDAFIDDLSQAIELDPDDALAYLMRGFAYENKGGLDQAISDYREALKLSDDPSIKRDIEERLGFLGVSP